MKKILLYFLCMAPLFAFSTGTWTKQTSGVTAQLLDVYTINPTTTFAVGTGGVIIKTEDGGKNWSSVSSPANSDLYNIHFTDAKNGYTTGNQALRTTDSGKTWSKMNVTSISGVLLRDMFWFSKSVGYIGGTTWSSTGYLFKTNDGGTTWSQITLPSCKGIYGMAFTDANTGFLATYGGEILKTVDGGSNWSKQTITSKILSRIYAYNSKELFVTGRDGALFSSTDSGKTWNSVYSGNETVSEMVMYGKNGFAVGGSIPNNTGTILTSTDSGQSWSSSSSNTSRLSAIDFYSADLGYAVGGDGSILKYTNNSLSIKEEETSFLSITLYPNPARETINLEFDSKIALKDLNIRIMDAQGRLVKEVSAEYNSQLQLNINSLSSGNYFILISSNSRVLDSKQFVVVR